MKWSQTYIPTLRDDQSEAELISHQLLLRAGYIRKLASGIYLHLPLMQRVIEKFSAIVREEMNRAGALEISMSVLCPAELWRTTGRYETVGNEQMRLKDRHKHEMILCGTHEETVTSLIRGEVKSYRQLPLNLYQIQVKFRDEVRPRFGLLRGREFLMKDAYSFDATEESFQKSYQKMVDAYFRVFKRTGLEVVKVESDSGTMGGNTAHEFMLPVETSAGEETIFLCDKCDYAANIEKAEFGPINDESTDTELMEMETVDTPGAATIEEVTAFLGVRADALAKTLLYVADGQPIAAMVRGDRELNPAKLRNATGAAVIEMATADEVVELTSAPVGFAGPVGLTGCPIYVDPLVAGMSNMIVGANENEKHIRGVKLERDFKAKTICDLTLAQDGDCCPRCDGRLNARRGIEVGNSFMLGTKYSEALDAKFLDAKGKEQAIIMGSYGIGITRTAQAVVELFHDDRGIVWPQAIAPYKVHLIPLNLSREAIRDAAMTIYRDLTGSGYDVLMDDRSDRAGVKFNDADLLGLPVRVVIGDKSLKEGQVELKARNENEAHLVPIGELVPAISDLLNRLK